MQYFRNKFNSRRNYTNWTKQNSKSIWPSSSKRLGTNSIL